jgi:hypothetical protein
VARWRVPEANVRLLHHEVTPSFGTLTSNSDHVNVSPDDRNGAQRAMPLNS